jgi:K+-transporting ATPase A subunit
MSLEEQASSWALSLFDALESPSHKRTRIYAAVIGAAVTLIMWIVHLRDPELLASLFESKGLAKLSLALLLAPPFVVAFTAGSFIYPQPIEPETKDEIGPMSTYLYQERSSRRWKLLIVAGIIAAVNFVLMLITSGL